MRHRFVYFALAALTAGLALAQDAPASRGGIPTFRFDLRSRTSDDVLPFDVRFNVRAKVNADVESGKLLVVNNTRSTCGCDKKRLTLPEGDPCRLVWGKASEGPVVQNGNDRELLFNADSLEANSDYCFLFQLSEKPEQTELDDLKRRARPLIEEQLATPKRQLDPPEIEALRLRIGTLLTALAKSKEQTAEIAKGTVFDPEAEEDVKEPFSEALRKVTQANFNAQNSAKSFCDNRKSARDKANEALKDGAPARDLLMAISTSADDKVAALIDVEAERALRNVLDRGFDSVLNDDTCASLHRFTRTTDIDTPLANVVATRQQFEAVVRIADAVLAQPELAKAIGYDTSGKRSTARGARDTLEAVRASIRALESRLQNVATSIRDRQAALADLEDFIDTRAAQTVSILGTSTETFTTRHSRYVSMDVGLASAWDINEAFSYVGLNFYRRPINKEAPCARERRATSRAAHR